MFLNVLVAKGRAFDFLPIATYPEGRRTIGVTVETASGAMRKANVVQELT